MKKATLLIGLLMSTLWTFAQEKIGTISGTVTDAAGKPVEAATVQLLRATGRVLVKTAVTDRQGSFEIEKLAPGSYLVAVSAVGFTTASSAAVEVSASRPKASIPTIQLAAGSTELGNVTVTGRKPLIEQKIDRTVINVEAAPTNAGSTAMEVLEKSPGVTVSNDGTISLKGKQGVIVMMDGKPTYLSPDDLATVLKNMPASAVDQIEIMTNPSARYDASGNSGIINIKTKKSRADGFNGSIMGGGTLGLYSRGDKYLKPFKQTSSVNLNYRKGKTNLFSSINYNYREGKEDLDINRKFFDKNGALSSTSSSNSASNYRNNNYTLKLGMDYYADKKNIFGIVASGFAFFGRPRTNTDQDLINPNGSLQSTLISQNATKLTFYNFSTNVNYKHNFDSAGRELTADLDWLGYNSGRKTMLQTDVYDGTHTKTGNLTLRGDIPGIINIYSAKTDYVHPLKKEMRLEAGAKLSYVSNDNTVNYDRNDGAGWVPDSRSNHFIYDENINAAYVNLSKKWKKWSGQAGLRVENTNIKGQQVINDSSFT
ncbi:MAG: outer membrane beta-barrel protein, partial [Bacteroidetes bacterium]|nr:outer membrane beta-barrel protein [Bacteroidota bacterium]